MADGLTGNSLDHDLIAAKSFSLSARYAMQRERDRERVWSNFFDDSPRNSIWDMARKIAGVK